MPTLPTISVFKDKSIQYSKRPSPEISGALVCGFDLSGRDGFVWCFDTGKSNNAEKAKGQGETVNRRGMNRSLLQFVCMCIGVEKFGIEKFEIEEFETYAFAP